MRFSGLKLRFSLQSLFLATLVTALLLQGRLSALQLQRRQRHEVFVTDIREQVIAAQRIEPQYARRLLAYVERRLTQSRDAALLTPLEQRQLLQLVQSAQFRIATIVQPAAPTSANVPASEHWALADAQACPW